MLTCQARDLDHEFEKKKPHGKQIKQIMKLNPSKTYC